MSSNFESSGPDVKIKGNAIQVHERYQALARDALSSGDRVAAENYLQHAEHYQRIINANLAAAAAAAEANSGRTGGDGGDGFNQPESRGDGGGRSRRGRGGRPMMANVSPDGEQPDVIHDSGANEGDGANDPADEGNGA